jgi:hypothetical protein
VKEQYNRLLITGKQIEADLTEHLRKAELDFQSRISTLNEEKQNLEKEIRETNATPGDVTAARVRIEIVVSFSPSNITTQKHIHRYDTKRTARNGTHFDMS